MGIFDNFFASLSLADVVSEKPTDGYINSKKNDKRGNLYSHAQESVSDKLTSKQEKSLIKDGCIANLSDVFTGRSKQLPAICPLLTIGPCPVGCRFESKFLHRMMYEGVLPTKDGCLVRRVCGVNTEEKKMPGMEITLKRERKG